VAEVGLPCAEAGVSGLSGGAWASTLEAASTSSAVAADTQTRPLMSTSEAKNPAVYSAAAVVVDVSEATKTAV
jgi:hypothetical protein